MRSLAILIAGILLTTFEGGAAGNTTSTDACKAAIPAALQAAVAVTFPDMALPQESDNLAWEAAAERAKGSSGCLGFATGPYQSANEPAYALLLTSRTSGDTWLVVASQDAGAWRFERLRNWGKGRQGFSVGSVPQGTFRRTQALDYPPNEPGEVSTYRSTNPCIVSGKIESTAVVFCHARTRWVHIWVSN